MLDGVPLASTTEIQKRAREIYGRPLFYAGGDLRLFEPPIDETQREALFVARRAVVRAAPGAYLAHRWRHFSRVLDIAKSKDWWPVHVEFVSPDESNAVQHDAYHSLLQRTLIRPVLGLSETVLFRPYLYAILALVLLPFAITRRQRDTVMLLVSAIAYELALFFVANSAEYRDSHWMITAVVLAIVLLVGRGASTRLESRNERVGG
jgi:hypothetical protein